MTTNSHSFHPTTTSGVADLVERAIADKSKLRLRGTAPEQPEPTDHVSHVLLDKMAAVVDYPARDMTITVQAGLSLRDLNAILAEENQQLPVDVPDDSASVGSIVAGDIAGARQYGYGTLRDYLIGIEGVDGQARVFHAGGRVVKNVAGYDLCRLMVGSRGMLAVLTQLTLKLKPVPEHSLLRTFRFDQEKQFRAALDRLNASSATPVLLDFTYAPSGFVPSAPEGAMTAGSTNVGKRSVPYAIHVGVEGTEASCRWQVDRLAEECSGGEEVHFDGEVGWSVGEFCRDRGHGWGCVSIRCRPSQVADIAAELAALEVPSFGHAGNGIVFVASQRNGEDCRAMCEEVGRPFGAVVSQWETDHPAFAADEITKRLRATFDPHSIFTQ